MVETAANAGTLSCRRTISFEVQGVDSTLTTSELQFDRLIIAGWAGRDVRAVEDHARELAELGVQPPSSIPVFYRAGVEALTTSPTVQVLGPDSSGEVEAVLLAGDDDIFVAVGSDHTDRRVESYSIAVSKQMCPKPVSLQVWRYREVADHWDSLVLRSYATIGEQRQLYQEGSLASLQPPDVLFAKLGGVSIPAKTAMFGGTLSAIGGIRPMDAMELVLEDPVLKRSLHHSYAVEVLPIVS